MIDRFSERARRAMTAARRASGEFGHDFIGGEHMLVGILDSGRGVAVEVLHRLGADPAAVRADVERSVRRGPHTTVARQVPFTPRAKRALELALETAQELKHRHIGTEHLLAGLVRERDGLAAEVLARHGADAESVMREMRAVLGGEPAEAAAPRPRATTDATESVRLARAEAQAMRHTFVGTEHLLLGVLAAGGPAADAIRAAGVSADAVRASIAAVRAPGDTDSGSPPQEFSPLARSALDGARATAERLGHATIDARHVAIALASQPSSLACHVLRAAGADVAALRATLELIQPQA